MNIYIVQKGDTLWKIAKKFNVSFEQLKRLNNHLANPDYIVPGMELFLPEESSTPHNKEHMGKENIVRPKESPISPVKEQPKEQRNQPLNENFYLN